MTSFLHIESDFIKDISTKLHINDEDSSFIKEMYQMFVMSRYELIKEPISRYREHINLQPIYNRLKENAKTKYYNYTICLFSTLVFYIVFMMLAIYKTNILSQSKIEYPKQYIIPDYILFFQHQTFNIYAIEVITATSLTMIVAAFTIYSSLNMGKYRKMVNIIERSLSE